MQRPLKFLNHKIEENALDMTYNPVENTGSVIFWQLFSVIYRISVCS